MFPLKLLVVEDDQELASALSAAFAAAGMAAEFCASVEAAQQFVELYHFDVLVVDRSLPDADGLDLVQSLRRSGNQIPTIVLTAQTQAMARVEGLDRGADDCLGKPFLFAELRARIEAVLRRAEGRSGNSVSCGNLSYDLSTRQGSVAGKPVQLTPREHAIVALLLRADGRPVSLARLEDALCSPAQALSTNALEVSVHRLRRKLEAYRCTATVQAVRGLGYCLQQAAE